MDLRKGYLKATTALFLTFGFAVSAHATLVTVNMTADYVIINGGLCNDASCDFSTDWYLPGPTPNLNDWARSDSVVFNLGTGTHHFAWHVYNFEGNPAALFAEILWDGNAKRIYTSNRSDGDWDSDWDSDSDSDWDSDSDSNHRNSDQSEWVRTSVTVPEPATLTLFGLGLLGVGLSRRRRRAV